MSIVRLQDIWQMYHLKFVIDGATSWDQFWALKGVSFSVEEGETLGIIGENGAGKSTLLKVIAGILKQDRGECSVSGKVTGLFELGAGFQPELTGEENIYLNARLFGLSDKMIGERYKEIVDFAALGKFIHAPVKCYSQGMFVRLAFAIAIHMNPDVLLIDDTLAVGDERFQNKCLKKIFELQDQKKTIIIVTHDLHLLKRLCRRVILLKEGRLIKDDSVEKVVPLYSQLEAAKKSSVAFLEQDKLRLIFNNGRLFVNWQEALLTPHYGAYAVFCAAKKWYSSLQAQWEVTEADNNKIVAVGTYPQLDLKLYWRLELCANHEINLDIEMEMTEPLEITEAHIDLLLNAGYMRWVAAAQESGEFPHHAEQDHEWQELLHPDAYRRSIGVEKEAKAQESLPSLLFTCMDDSGHWRAHILNSDFFTRCRVLQFRALALNNDAHLCDTRLKLFSGKLKVNILNLQQHLEQLQDAYSIKSGPLKITQKKGYGILAHAQSFLTTSMHISTSLCAAGNWYESHSAKWVVKKDSSQKLSARGSWPGLNLFQYWQIEQRSDGAFTWKIGLELQDTMEIDQQRAQFMCSAEYARYFSEYGEGGFPELFMQNEADILQKCLPAGKIGLSSDNERYPELVLSFLPGEGSFAKILNSDFYHKARILRIEKITPELKRQYKPGRYPCFEIDFAIPQFKHNFQEQEKLKLCSGNSSFVFEKGKGSLFCGNKELTKGMGFYTSIRSRGKWYDSLSQALWKAEEAPQGSLKITGKWIYLPISQVWQIKAAPNNSFECAVALLVDEEVQVERLQTNLMLSETYSEWSVDGSKGDFPDFKAGISDDWECLWQAVMQKQNLALSAKSACLPQVVFMPSMKREPIQLKIVNSDVYHRGRILQCLDEQSQKLAPGEYHYFSGVVKIE